MNDLKKDVETHKELIKNSEEKRHQLQVHITETSVIIKEDTHQHNNY